MECNYLHYTARKWLTRRIDSGLMYGWVCHWSHNQPFLQPICKHELLPWFGGTNWPSEYPVMSAWKSHDLQVACETCAAGWRWEIAGGYEGILARFELRTIYDPPLPVTYLCQGPIRSVVLMSDCRPCRASSRFKIETFVVV